MKSEVAQAIEELRRQFPDAAIEVTEEGQGGAMVVVNPVRIGPRFVPQATWLGAHIPALYPYADIYPVFMDAQVRRADGIAFVPPITPNATFAGRPALQISRRNPQVQQYPQTTVMKFLKVIDFLEKLP
jgi:hypothetical protein